MKKILLILNPNSGRGLGKQYLPTIKKFFKNQNLDTFLTKKAKDATNKAKANKNKYNIIIAAGGDGTINEVVNGLIGGKASLAIIPIGTANALASQFNIPTDVHEACKLILKKKPKKVDIGKANNHYFLQSCGVGFDSKVISDVNTKYKQKTGKLLFYLNIIKNLFRYDLPKLRIIVDNKVTNGYTAIIMNSKYYAGNFIIAPKAKIDDGILNIIVIEKNSPLLIIQAVLGGHLFGKLLDFDDFSHYTGKNIKIQSIEKKSFIQTDGELIGIAPVEVKVLNKKLSVIY
tara:strand:- start:16023 stop:16886 length:864 start_codon:yes stop_codon:yes gene_type:complete